MEWEDPVDAPWKHFHAKLNSWIFLSFFIASHTTTFITKCMTWRLISRHDVGPSCCFSYLSQNKHEQCHPHWSLSCPSWLACYHCAHIPLLSPNRTENWVFSCLFHISTLFKVRKCHFLCLWRWQQADQHSRKMFQMEVDPSSMKSSSWSTLIFKPL